MPLRRKAAKNIFKVKALTSLRLCGKKKLSIIFLFFLSTAFSQNFTHTDSLRGTITKERMWWNVLHYDLHVAFNFKDSSISGYNKIFYQIEQPNKIMQIDLQVPLILDSVIQDGKHCSMKRDGNAFFISLKVDQKVGNKKEIYCYYHGKPRKAVLPPWDGGLVWKKDSKGNPWVSIACQGLGASVWFPNKDHQYDEPDSVSIYITAPKELMTVSNGRMRSKKTNSDGTDTFNWAVKNPINAYNIIPYIGNYVNFNDTLNGEGGKLDLSFWVLQENLEKAKEQFKEVKPMLRCFEHWFGKYPFYEDGYKLVDAPYLGMEHQSAVAYGNNYKKGYNGRDLSLSGWGMKWDFIIVHESGHEWFGNNITTKDMADNWIHEGFTAYSENLYTEYLFGKEAGADYVIGTRKAISNDVPLIGSYDVNNEGSTDIYYKGANLLHMIRQIVNNDSLWREMLRGLNKTFWHQTVTTRQIEEYMINFLKIDLQKIFDQYLRTVQVPVLEYKIAKGKLSYRFTNCIKGFSMPVKIKEESKETWLIPNENFQILQLKSKKTKFIIVDRNFYISDKIAK